METGSKEKKNAEMPSSSQMKSNLKKNGLHNKCKAFGNGIPKKDRITIDHTRIRKYPDRPRQKPRKPARSTAEVYKDLERRSSNRLKEKNIIKREVNEDYEKEEEEDKAKMQYNRGDTFSNYSDSSIAGSERNGDDFEEDSSVLENEKTNESEALNELDEKTGLFRQSVSYKEVKTIPCGSLEKSNCSEEMDYDEDEVGIAFHGELDDEFVSQNKKAKFEEGDAPSFISQPNANAVENTVTLPSQELVKESSALILEPPPTPTTLNEEATTLIPDEVTATSMIELLPTCTLEVRNFPLMEPNPISYLEENSIASLIEPLSSQEIEENTAPIIDSLPTLVPDDERNIPINQVFETNFTENIEDDTLVHGAIGDESVSQMENLNMEEIIAPIFKSPTSIEVDKRDASIIESLANQGTTVTITRCVTNELDENAEISKITGEMDQDRNESFILDDEVMSPDRPSKQKKNCNLLQGSAQELSGQMIELVKLEYDDPLEYSSNVAANPKVVGKFLNIIEDLFYEGDDSKVDQEMLNSSSSSSPLPIAPWILDEEIQNKWNEFEEIYEACQREKKVFPVDQSSPYSLKDLTTVLEFKVHPMWIEDAEKFLTFLEFLNIMKCGIAKLQMPPGYDPKTFDSLQVQLKVYNQKVVRDKKPSSSKSQIADGVEGLTTTKNIDGRLNVKSKNEHSNAQPPTTFMPNSYGILKNPLVKLDFKKEKVLMDYKDFRKQSNIRQPVPTDLKGKPLKGEELDKVFWDYVEDRLVNYAQHTPGSAMSENPGPFNLGSLNTLVSKTDWGNHGQGIHTPMLYAGGFGAAFAFHVEDFHMYSANYLIGGAEKVWYAVPPCFGFKLMDFLNKMIQEFYWSKTNCESMCLHKMFMIRPENLKKLGIPFIKVIQCPNDMIITAPFCFHQGFNRGFCLNEAVNCGTPNWLSYAKYAPSCWEKKCVGQNQGKMNLLDFVNHVEGEGNAWAAGKEIGKHPEEFKNTVKYTVGPKIKNIIRKYPMEHSKETKDGWDLVLRKIYKNENELKNLESYEMYEEMIHLTSV